MSIKKVLIKISSTYQVKNKLQKQILENIEELDGTLTDSSTANKLILLAYKDAINNYKGSAIVPELRNFVLNEGIRTYYVENVFYLNIYHVKHEILKSTEHN